MPDLLREFHELRGFGGFDLIMADPPWSFANYSARGEGKNPKAQYDCMDLAAIKAMPVEALAANDCLLWLWAVNPMLPQALEVMAAWGFEFATAGTWVKRTVHGKDAFGTGYVLRSSSEPFLIGRRGRPTTTRATRSTVASYLGDDGARAAADADEARGRFDGGVGTVTVEAVAREHSRKPDEAFKAAEALMPAARRIELFSRQRRPGWCAWGNEIEKFEEVENA